MLLDARDTPQVAAVKRVCTASQMLLLLVTAPLYVTRGMAIDWVSALPVAAVFLVLAGLHWHFKRAPGAADEAIVADVVRQTLLMLTLFALAAPAQYVLLRSGRPLADPWLDAGDRFFGVDVAALTAWTRQHPSWPYVLLAGYVSFVPQLFATPLMLGLVLRRTERLWEFCFHFHFCLLATLVIFSLWPAAHPFTYRHFEPAFDWTRFSAQFAAVRDGSLDVVRFGRLEGLVAMPSFHTVGALMVIWAMRGYRLWPAAVALNALLIASTLMTGTHYFVDVVAAAVLFGASIAAYQLLIRRSTAVSPGSPSEPRLRV